MFYKSILTGLVLGAFALPAPSQANSGICGERNSMVSKLKEKYGEAERGMGLSGTEAVVEIWSSSKTGTWTIVMTRPDGTTCVVAAGDNWVDAGPEEKGQGA